MLNCRVKNHYCMLMQNVKANQCKTVKMQNSNDNDRNKHAPISMDKLTIWKYQR